ncbi:AAA family ATPase [Pectobacterium polaris]|uniref:AAA family ATPase n=1 Tax=Pectobacterium polaris TaxID=2042057 RepID=UPI001583D3C3|nr:AAA family ATPase [Pectobacterium polaris]
MDNKKNELEEFQIHGLNDEINVNLKFTDNLKIIVSENGRGKTTIISMLYYFLKNNPKIGKYKFNSLTIKNKNIESITYSKQVLKLLFNDSILDSVSSSIAHFDVKIIKELNNLLGINKSQPLIASLIIYITCHESTYKKWQEDVQKFINEYYIEFIATSRINLINALINNIRNLVENEIFFFSEEGLEFSFNELYLNIQDLCHSIIESPDIELDLGLLIDKLYYLQKQARGFEDKEFIYLPTYRLIESNLSSFRDKDALHSVLDGFDETKDFFEENPIIQFGMEKIKNTWGNLSNQIRASTTEDFLKLSGRLLTNIVNNRTIRKEEINELLNNKESVSKIISRINQDALTNKNKASLLKIINDGDLGENNNKNALFYILENMVTIHKNQRHIDESIEQYKDAINTFFTDKKLIFNDITSEIFIEKTKTKKKIDIENLSSGEKQILSLFTKLHLSNISEREKKYWIFFDEPEISLSIEWQSILIPKMIKSGKCEFLIAATHSPFIFKSKELKKYTSDLSLDIKEI